MLSCKLSPSTLQHEILNDPTNMEVGLASLLGFSSARHLAKMYALITNKNNQVCADYMYYALCYAILSIYVVYTRYVTILC